MGLLCIIPGDSKYHWQAVLAQMAAMRQEVVYSSYFMADSVHHGAPEQGLIFISQKSTRDLNIHAPGLLSRFPLVSYPFRWVGGMQAGSWAAIEID